MSKDLSGLLPFLDLLRPNLEPRGRCYIAYPSRHRVRWLVPVEPPLRRIGSNLLTPTGVKRFLGKSLVAAGWFWGERVWLDVTPLEEELVRVLGQPGMRLAFYLGTSGAYRKLTVQIITSGGRVPAYAKIAEHAWAQAALECEYQTLMRLSAVDALSERVPRPLASFLWNNARILLVTAGPNQMGPRRLMASHAEFLERLHRAFADERPFETSRMWHRMAATMSCLESRMPKEWSRRFQRALNELHDTLGKVTLPLSMAHRDFAPWNTRLDRDGLFVFDWEAASEGTTPLFDALHFQAIQAALSGKPFRASRDWLEGIVARLWHGGMTYLPRLWLAYLTDMSMYYAEARVGFSDVGEERVWSWLGRQIDMYLARTHAVA